MVLFVTNGVKAQVKSFLDMPYLEVNGNADTLVTPNEIWIGITISEADVKNKVSLEEQERKMDKFFYRILILNGYIQLCKKNHA